MRFWLILTILVNLLTFYQLLRPGFFPMQDDLQAFRIHQMVACLKDFQIPCRWVPDMGYQYGYPQFNYYPPLPYYIGGIFSLIGIQIIDSVKLLFILGFILSALTMFIFLKSFLNDYAACLGSILYTIVPVKAVQVYVRGSLSEFLAFIFLPLLLWSSLKLIRIGKTKYLLWLAVSLALLITTHNLTTLIFLPILLVWILTIISLEKKWKMFYKIISGVLLGIGLSAFYILPFIFEKKYVHLETLLGGYFDYRQHFVSIKQLLFSNYFYYGSSVFGLFDEVSLSAGIVHWIVALLALFLSFTFYKKYKKLSITLWVLFALESIYLFLMHQRSYFFWEKISTLAWLQFPWRFLVPSAFLLSIFGAISAFLISKLNKNYAVIFTLVVVLSLILLHGAFFKPKEWLNISDKDKFSGESWEKQLTISIFDYLPIFAKLPPNEKAPLLPDVLDGEVEFLSYQKGSNFQKGEALVKEAATLRLPLFDFPGMQVLVDGMLIHHINNDCRREEYCLGLITFNIEEGKHKIEVQLKDTPVRSLGNIISLVSLFLTAFLSIKYGFKKFF